MGYSTDFSGTLQVQPAMKKEHINYINKFSETRRMERNPEIALTLPDPIRDAVELPVGPEGAYFVGGAGTCGQHRDASIKGYNSPPGQPGLWCQWIINPVDPEAKRTECTLGWDGGEKFYNYVEWLEYLITHFLEPWGYTLNGEIMWQGESIGDVGKIVVKNNTVQKLEATFN